MSKNYKLFTRHFSITGIPLNGIAKALFTLALLLIVGSAFGQKLTTIKGRVFDAKTKQPLPFVDVILKGTYVGESTDLDGQYLIQTKNPSDSIQVSFIGYKSIERRFFYV